MSRIINIGCPVELYQALTVAQIKSKLEEDVNTFYTYQVLPDGPGKRISIAMRLSDELALQIIKGSIAHNISIVEFTARLLML